MLAPRVYLVDDDESVRLSTQSLLELNGLEVLTYCSGKSLLDDIERVNHGCIMVDYQMPQMSGLDLMVAVRRMGKSLPFLLVTGYATIPLAVDALKLGAVNVIEKPYQPASIVNVVRSVMMENDHAKVLSTASTKAIDLYSSLTPRELQVLRLIVQGFRTKQIAAMLEISVKTVEVHRCNMTRKFQVNSVAQLVAQVLKYDSTLACLEELCKAG